VILESHSSGGSMTIEPLGLTLEEVHPTLSAHLPQLAEGGVIVTRVREQSLARFAGWKMYDILTAIDETPIGSIADAQQRLQQLHNKSDHTFHIIRAGQPQIVGARPTQESKR
jgi:S1-C subfamily serine protease